MPTPRRRRSRFVPAKGLDAAVARAVAAPAVTRFADEVEAEAKRNMPEAKMWLCLAPESRVAAFGTLDAVRRLYVGRALRLTFRSASRLGAAPPPDRVLTVTPNHPLFTTRGWVAAEFLKEGDQAFGSALFDPAASGPHEHDRPPALGEVFRASALTRPPERVMRPRLDLDGEQDGSSFDGDVDVVAIDGTLRDVLDAHAVEMFPELAFSRGGAGDVTFPASGPRLARLLGRPLAALRRRARARAGQRPFPVGAPPLPMRLAEGAECHPAGAQEASDRGEAGTVPCGNPAHRHAVSVEAFDLVAVEVIPWSGHVYDLTTRAGWLFAEGMIVHNSMRDELVRHTHVRADGQTIPANLRFRVGRDLLRAPRDPNGSIEEVANCRCEDPRLPDAVRDAVSAGPTRVAGTRASARVAVVFERIDEVEFGTAEEPPLRPMGNAARTVASRHRSA